MLPTLPTLSAAVMMGLQEMMFTVWNNPENPELDFFYKDLVTEEGYTEFDPYPVGEKVLTAPIVAPFANPRAILPVVDGKGKVINYINHYEVKVSISDETVDEYERKKLTAKVFGSSVEAMPAEDRFAARMEYGRAACINRFVVNAMNLIELASLSAVNEATGVNVVNTFVRKEVTTVAALNTSPAPYANLTAGSLTGRRWVNSDGSLNTSAKPVADVQTQIATLKFYGAGGAKYFIMSPLAMAAYNRDFQANYSEWHKNTNMLQTGLMLTLPKEVMEQGWSIIGYVHDFSQAGVLIPVVGGSNVTYLDWMNQTTAHNLLPSYEFCFPVPLVPSIGLKHTWIKLQKLMKQQTLLGVNIWGGDNTESGAYEGAIYHRGTMYPRLSPNALVFWKV